MVADMSQSLLADAFAHHVWATLRLLDSCASLTMEQLETTVPGTYGSILETARHIVGSDAWYLSTMTEGRYPAIDEEHMDMPELRAEMERHGSAWTELLDTQPDPETIVIRRRDDGSEFHAPLGIRLAQVVHHGTDHRSQICTVLTTLGVEPPEIDLWAFGDEMGRVVEVDAVAVD
jgi:uncharacterized damage-inducible protein DinB